MAFPAVGGSQTSFNSVNSLTLACAMPASVAASDLLLLFVAHDGTGTGSCDSGFNELKDHAGTGFTDHIFYKIAAGGETSATFTCSVSERSNALAVKITASTWHGTTPPEVNTVVTGNSVSPDPGSITPSWGAADTLYIAVGFWDTGDVTGYPSTYPDNRLPFTLTATAASTAYGAIATRNLNATSDDPGAFTIAIETWAAYAMAVRPAVAANPSYQPRVYPHLLPQ
jgi:hypothetical protein